MKMNKLRTSNDSKLYRPRLVDVRIYLTAFDISILALLSLSPVLTT